uniref:HhH-GPD domain-containing protein n=1 Tax=Panagrolaimus sp. PS1159 TaxID=55785 RepID=A0AC35GJ54_9BILA
MDEEIQNFYDFPSIEQMAIGLNEMEKVLREKGFGYRAKYIAKTVETLSKIDGGFEKWEKKLKEMEYADAKVEIQKLDGVGPKVADCICLMALNQHHVVPVDTHVFQITALHYLPELKKSKNVTDVIYRRIKFYAERFGSHAGWAHSVLFSTRLKRFKSKEKLQEEDTVEIKKKK